MEKAWAKTVGNYELIWGGLPNDVFDYILGAPTIQYTVSNFATGAAIFQVIQQAITNNFVVGSWTSHALGGDSTYNSYGLPNGHAYSVLGAFVVTDANGVSHNLIQMRNPWGYLTTYNGTWADGNAVWTSAVIA
jgi:hypothetical protein